MQIAVATLSRSLALLALVVPLAFASAALADSKTKLIGNSSGTPFTAACPEGQALVGWGYNATDHLTSIAPMCQPVDGDHTTGVATASPKDVYGADDPAALSGNAVICPDGGLMRTLTVSLTSSLRVHHIRPTCKAPNHAPIITTPTRTNGGAPPAAESNVSCRADSFATGMIGTYSDSLATGGVLSLGLICFAPGKQKPAPVADNPPTDSSDNDDNGDADNGGGGGDNADVPADNGGGFDFQITIGPDGLNFGPKGKVRTVAEPTTLYSDRGNTEIAYFDRGDRVVVAGCEKKGRGWCQVIRPQPGLIWGGDMK
jgi:hypothetical protein